LVVEPYIRLENRYQLLVISTKLEKKAINQYLVCAIIKVNGKIGEIENCKISRYSGHPWPKLIHPIFEIKIFQTIE
jgi:hypothetical protein